MSTPQLTIDSVPSLGASYLAAAAGALRPVREVAGPLITPELVTTGVRVPSGTVTAYQHLVGASLRDTVPTVVLHGTLFPLALTLMRRGDFPLPLTGLVHLRNEVRLHRPVGIDEELTLRVRAEDLTAHHAGTAVWIVGTASAGDTDVFTTRSLYLARGVKLQGTSRPQAPEHPEFVPPLPTGAWRLDGATGRRYAAVLGDYNPIHLTPLTARVAGRKRPIAHGMYLAGRALAGLEPADAGFSWEIEFATPVSLPGTVSYRVERSADGSAEFLGWDARRNRPHFNGRVSAPR